MVGDNHTIGILALQGAFREHCEIFRRLGCSATEVRTTDDLGAVDALVMPGGESTTIGKLLVSSKLDLAIAKRLEDGDLSIFGTCAGLILCATRVLDGIADQVSLSIFDATVRRNGIGPQRYSFETKVTIGDSEVSAVFIRPPVVENIGPNVEVLAEYEQSPVLCAQGSHLFATFHPELTSDTQVHELFLTRLDGRIGERNDGGS